MSKIVISKVPPEDAIELAQDFGVTPDYRFRMFLEWGADVGLHYVEKVVTKGILRKRSVACQASIYWESFNNKFLDGGHYRGESLYEILDDRYGIRNISVTELKGYGAPNQWMNFVNGEINETDRNVSEFLKYCFTVSKERKLSLFQSLKDWDTIIDESSGGVWLMSKDGGGLPQCITHVITENYLR